MEKSILATVDGEYEQDQMMQQERLDSIDFINALTEKKPSLLSVPDEFIDIPVLRDDRVEFFNAYPEAQAVWGAYNKMVNQGVGLQKAEKIVQKLNKENIVLEKSHLTAKTDAQRQALDAKLESNRKQLAKLTVHVKEEGKQVAELVKDFTQKMGPWKQILQQADDDRAEEIRAEREKQQQVTRERK